MKKITFPHLVILNPKEARMAALSAVDRVVESLIELNRRETYGSARNTTVWSRHIEGAMGEYAVSKVTGRHWPGAGIVFDQNIPKDTGVSTTAYENGRLIVHPESPDNCAFWLVTGCIGVYTIRGWIRGWEAKQKKYWSDPSHKDRPAYFVPVEALRKSYTRQERSLREWQDYAKSLERELNRYEQDQAEQPGAGR
jgi:hypothetical protein